jgi:hypothetical protein
LLVDNNADGGDSGGRGRGRRRGRGRGRGIGRGNGGDAAGRGRGRACRGGSIARESRWSYQKKVRLVHVVTEGCRCLPHDHQQA